MPAIGGGNHEFLGGKRDRRGGIGGGGARGTGEEGGREQGREQERGHFHGE